MKPLQLGTLLLSLAMSTNVLAATETVNQPLTTSADTKTCPDFLSGKMRKLHSEQEVDLCQLSQGKTLLIVNTASKCGFTPQFAGLEKLHKTYQDKGLVVIGFPSDDFFQEEDDEKDTAKVCYVNYGVTFTMLETTAVRGDDANQVFRYLAKHSTAPKWNFYKYLVTANGEKVQHFNSKVTPDAKELLTAIEQAL